MDDLTKHIIKGLRKQKPKAQRQAFDRYGAYLFRVCFRYLGQKEWVEDVLSMVFVKVFDKISATDIQKETQLKAWMKKIAINECLQEIRKHRLFLNSLELTEDIEETGLPADHLLLEADILRLIQDLPLGYRTVFSLYVIEGYTHQQIASYLHISEGTSKSQLNKARAILKTRLIKNGIR